VELLPAIIISTVLDSLIQTHHDVSLQTNLDILIGLPHMVKCILLADVTERSDIRIDSPITIPHKHLRLHQQKEHRVPQAFFSPKWSFAHLPRQQLNLYYGCVNAPA
jgi:hypothetical protein